MGESTSSAVARTVDKLLAPVLLTAVFVFSRLYFRALGVRFDLFPLVHFWQILDVPILEGDLSRGLWYLHSQPPGFNLFLGVLLKLFPDPPRMGLHFAFLSLGLVLLCLVYAVLRAGGVGRWPALALSSLFSLGPGAVLYEHWLFYTRPVSVLLVLAALALLRYERQGRRRYALLFLAALTALCLTRAVFHVVYLAGCAGLMLSVRAPTRKWLTASATGALALVLLVYLKNAALFGVFGVTSWSGMNLWRVVSDGLAKGEAAAMAARGELPPVAAVRPFDYIKRYPSPYGRVPACYSDIPLLANETKAGTWVKNLNHYAYIRISRDYARAAFTLIRDRPALYRQGLARSWSIYLRPSWDFKFVRRNRRPLRGVITVFSGFLTGLPGEKGWAAGERLRRCRLLSGSLIVAGMLLCAGAALTRLRSAVHGRGGAALLFMIGTVLYVAAIGNCFELGENNRFRAMTDPLLFVAAVLASRRLLLLCSAGLRKRLGGRAGSVLTSSRHALF